MKVGQKVIFDKILEVNLENKVYPKTYHHYRLGHIKINETPTNINIQ